MDWVLSFLTPNTTETPHEFEHYYHTIAPDDPYAQPRPQTETYVLKTLSCNGYVYEPQQLPDREETIAMRNELIGSAQTMFYPKEPLMVVKARGQYLFDDKGRKYLDCISNVQHVGHCHPAVVQAVAQQMSMTNCNNRFLHGTLVECARQIKHTLPKELDALYMCNSGSEANDLALRMARDYTGGIEVIVLEHAYHGHLTSIIDISPYKFDRIGDKKPWVHVAPLPDAYRGKHRLSDADLHNVDKQRELAQKYANEVRAIVDKIKADGKRLCAFYMESLESCGGQVIPPPGYLEQVLEIVHSAGGLVVCDEVQTGFGRCGTHFWAWQSHSPDAIPDIITMGKPMGNGFPVSSVWTRHTVASKLGKGVEYFNTFAGNPVACAAVLSVMRVLRTEQLQQNAIRVGAHFMRRLRQLQQKHNCIGDVRGVGLFIGIDLVTDRATRTPATQLAADCMLLLRREHNILLNSEGPHSNVVKIKPPMCFTLDNVDEVCGALDDALTKLTCNKRQ